MAKTKVLHVIGGGEVGGAEEHVLTLMKLLDPEKYQPFLLCLCEGPFADLAARQGLPARIIPMRHRLDLATVTPLMRYMGEQHFDLVHTHGVRANLVARLAATRSGIPVVTTVHSVLRYDYDLPLKALLAYFLTKLTNKYSNRFIAISRAIAHDIKQMGVYQEKIVIIHNGLDVNKFSSPRKASEVKSELGLDQDRQIITMVARLHPVKGHDYFLRAARQVIDAGFRPQFLIVGEGIYRRQIEQQVSELGLNEVVKMLGYYRSIEDIYEISDILCVPSVMEGLGLVVLEAMYFNVPVVASNTGGIPEIIKDQVDGLLVEPRDHHGLAQAIIKILSDPELATYLTTNARKKVNQFSLQNMANKVEQVYEEVLRSKKTITD
ncbi:MAG: glycosyltransferase family 4 protein [Syntrophomonadaceae bacterium]|jgi:glycosyltransferase involved in cell wall biosynthesis